MSLIDKDRQVKNEGTKWKITWSELGGTGAKMLMMDYSAEKPQVGSHTVEFQNIDGRQVILFRIKAVVQEL